MDASLTSPDAYDSALKAKEDVVVAVNDPVKRNYDEAFNEDHSGRNEA
jgi:hypothetical protein